jgi:hypothetical protein
MTAIPSSLQAAISEPMNSLGLNKQTVAGFTAAGNYWSQSGIAAEPDAGCARGFSLRPVKSTERCPVSQKRRPAPWACHHNTQHDNILSNYEAPKHKGIEELTEKAKGH